MLRQGTVIFIDHKKTNGIIRDGKKEYFFRIEDCHNFQMPSLFSQVTFQKDSDYKFTGVAILIKPDDLRQVI